MSVSSHEQSGLRRPVFAQREYSLSCIAPDIPEGGVLYYALGGGLGHFTRAAAIARQFRRLRTEPFLILTNRAVLPDEPVDVLQLRDRPAASELATLIGSLLKTLRPAVFVTDAFPAGILNELRDSLSLMRARRVTILRRLQPCWVERWQLLKVLKSYDAAAIIEPGASFAELPRSLQLIETAPVLIRDAKELWTRDEAKTAMQCETARPLVAVIGSGAKQDAAWLASTCRAAAKVDSSLQVRFIAPAGQGLSHYPFMELLPGCDFVVGACGYNLCHETAALNVPAMFLPQPRLYDDQWARARWRMRQSTPGRMEQSIQCRSHPQYENGAASVAILLAEMMD